MGKWWFSWKWFWVFEWRPENIYDVAGTKIIHFDGFPNTGLYISCINYPSSFPILFYTPICDRRSNNFLSCYILIFFSLLISIWLIYFFRLSVSLLNLKWPMVVQCVLSLFMVDKKHEIILCLKMSNAKWLHFYRIIDYCHLIRKVSLSLVRAPSISWPRLCREGRHLPGSRSPAARQLASMNTQYRAVQ